MATRKPGKIEGREVRHGGGPGVSQRLSEAVRIMPESQIDDGLAHRRPSAAHGVSNQWVGNYGGAVADQLGPPSGAGERST
jgi:hypothetical protein